MKNSVLNKLLKDSVNEQLHYYYKRIGECNPSNCGGACCRYNLIGMCNDDKYFKKVDKWFSHPIETVVYNKITYAVYFFYCPNITINGRCKIHGKRKQSEVCDKFPMSPTDVVYKYVTKYCGYKFEKVLIKNPKGIKKANDTTEITP